MLGFNALNLGLPSEMLGGVTNKIDEALFRFVVEIQIKGTGYFILAKLTDDIGHVFEISKASINGVLDEGVIRIVLVELIDMRKRERCVDICSGGVVPQANVPTDDFFAHDSAVGVLGRNFELEKDRREFFQGNRQRIGDLGGTVFPVSCGVLGKPVQSAPIERLQSLNLSFDGSKGRLDTSFGVFSLRVEVNCLPDSDAGENQGNKTGDNACNFHGSDLVKPNVELSRQAGREGA